MSCRYRGHPSSLARRENKRLGTVPVVIAMASTIALRVSSAVAMVMALPGTRRRCSADPPPPQFGEPRPYKSRISTKKLSDNPAPVRRNKAV